VAALGVSILLVPEVALRRRQPWDSLCRRVTVSWLVMFFSKFLIDHTNREYLYDLVFQRQASVGTPNYTTVDRVVGRQTTVVAPDLVEVTMTSPHGLVGICTAASCSSTGLWLIATFFVYGGSLPSTLAASPDGDVTPICHRRREAAHLLVVCLVCVVHRVQLVYYVAFVAVKVISYHAAMRIFIEAEKAMALSTRRVGPLIVYATVIGGKLGLEALSDEQFKNNNRMAVWLSFPTSVVGSLAVGALLEQVIRLKVSFGEAHRVGGFLYSENVTILAMHYQSC